MRGLDGMKAQKYITTPSPPYESSSIGVLPSAGGFLVTAEGGASPAAQHCYNKGMEVQGPGTYSAEDTEAWHF